MAIKEFVIGPQNYWEEGYFNGDYTLPNVAKFYLQCDIDNVKGGRVVTGLYYEDNYIDGTYWHDNTIRAAFSATANKIKDAQVQATGYFVEGYYATGYVEQGIASVLTATASVLIGTSAAISAQASTSTQAGKQVDSQTAMAAVFSQTAIGSRTSDIDLYAFSQGGLTSDVNAIRAYQLDALSSFNIATDYIRQRNTNSDAAAEFTQSIAFERNRDNASATQVAFSFAVNETLFKEFNSTLQSQASAAVDVAIFREVGATLSAQSQISCVISHIHGADIQATNFASISASADRTRDNDSQSSIAVSTNIDAVKITDTTANSQNEFVSNVLSDRTRDNDSQSSIAVSINAQAVATKVGIVSVEIQTNASCVISHIHGADIHAFDDAEVVASPEITRGYQSSQSMATTLSANNDRIRDNNSTFTDNVIQTATALRIQPGQSDFNIVSQTNVEVVATKVSSVNCSATSNVGCQISHIHGADIQANNFAQLASTPEITRDYQATASSVINLSADANRTRDNDSQSSITAALSATALRIQPGAADISTAFSSNVVAVKSVEALASQQVSSSIEADNGRLRESVIPEFSSQIQSNVVGNAVRGVQENFTAQTNVTAIIGTLESITLVVFNFASVIALPFVTAQASSGVSSNLSAGINAVKTVDGSTQIISAFDTINVPGDRIRYQDSTISSTTFVVTDNSRTRDNNSQIQSTATVSAIIGKLQAIDLYAFSNNSLITDPVVIRNAQSDVQTQFTLTASAGKIPPIDSAISTNVSLSAVNVRVRFADSTLSASGGVLSVVDVIPGVQVHMVGNFTTNRPYVDSGYVDDDYATNFETVANYIVDNLHQLVVASSLTANADYTVNGAALVASAGTLTINAAKTTVTSSSQTSTINVSSDIRKLVGFEIDVQSTFTIEAKAGSQEDIFGTFFNNVALIADVAKSVDVGSNNSIVSAFYANTENSLTTQGEASVSAEFTAVTIATKTARVSANIQALAFTVSLGSAIVVEQANISATVGFSADVNVVRSGVVASQSNASVTAQTGIRRSAIITISGAMTFVSEVREIRLDEIEYIIPAEGWEYQIVGEDRTYDIIGETRLRKIVGETRNRSIDGETRIYIIE